MKDLFLLLDDNMKIWLEKYLINELKQNQKLLEWYKKLYNNTNPKTIVKIILDKITRVNPDHYINATKKLEEILSKNSNYGIIFTDAPVIVTDEVIRNTDGISLKKVQDYKLAFGGNNTIDVRNPREMINGLKKFGPFYKKKDRITIGIVYADNNIEWWVLKEIKNKLISAFRNYFRIELNFLEPKRYSPTEPVVKCDILLHIHRKQSDTYWEIKRKYLRKNIPSQAILLLEYPSTSGNKNAYFNNLAIGMLGKLGDRPWTIGKPISEFLGKKAYYIGFDVSRKSYYGQSASAACIVAYDSEGTYVKHMPKTKVNIIKEHLDEQNASLLMQDILDDYLGLLRPENGSLKGTYYVVFMRDGVFSKSEVEGFIEKLSSYNNDLKDFKFGLYLLEFKKQGGIPILMRDNDKLVLAPEGTYLLARTLENPYGAYTLYIQTLGYGSGHSLVHTIKVSPRFYTYNGEEIGWPEKESNDLALMIYRLSRLNWASLRGRSKLPVTIHYAHRMAFFMENGVPADVIENTKLYFL